MNPSTGPRMRMLQGILLLLCCCKCCAARWQLQPFSNSTAAFAPPQSATAPPQLHAPGAQVQPVATALHAAVNESLGASALHAALRAWLHESSRRRHCGGGGGGGGCLKGAKHQARCAAQHPPAAGSRVRARQLPRALRRSTAAGWHRAAAPLSRRRGPAARHACRAGAGRRRGERQRDRAEHRPRLKLYAHAKAVRENPARVLRSEAGMSKRGVITQ